jgi:MerR family mercuric resistance operon transcriptional regulator
MMTIGKIAKQAGVGVETIRFYERKGLIKQPKKEFSEGFRSYSQDEALKIRFIKRAQELGFTLREIKELLDLNTNPRATCDDVRILAETKISEIEQKIKDLKQMKASVRQLEKACSDSRKAVACCRIIDCFDGKCT